MELKQCPFCGGKLIDHPDPEAQIRETHYVIDHTKDCFIRKQYMRFGIYDLVNKKDLSEQRKIDHFSQNQGDVFLWNQRFEK